MKKNILQIGKLAPNFLTVGVYKNQLGRIRLSDYYGKKYVVLIFYPSNFTTVSRTELMQLNNKINEFKKLSTQILAVSVDSPFCHLHFLLNKQNQINLNYPLLSDLNHKITKKYKLLTNEGFSLPGLFIIDKQGIIQYHTVNNLLCGRSINELLRILKSIQYVQENPGHVCCVDWKPGDKILFSHPLKSNVFLNNINSKF